MQIGLVEIVKRSISLKISVLLALGLLVVACLEISYRYFYLLPEHIQLENSHDQKELQRFNALMQQEQADLELLAGEYAIWTDTLDYIAQPDAEYIEENFTLDNFLSLGIDVVYLFNSDNKVIFEAAFDREDEESRRAPDIYKNKLAQLLIPQTAFDEVDYDQLSQSGLLITDQGLYIYGVSLVIHTSGLGETKGNLVMLRALDENKLDNLTAKSLLKISDISLVDPVKVKRPSLYRDSQVNNISAFYADNVMQTTYKVTLLLDERKFDHRLIDTHLAIRLITTFFAILILHQILKFLLVKPVIVVSKHLGNIKEKEDFSQRLNDRRTDEIGHLARSSDLLCSHIQIQAERILETNKWLRKQSETDALTQIYNRGYFDQSLEQCLNVNDGFSLLLFDIDFFKPYNDTYGHVKGDMVLRLVAQTLKNNLHQATDTLARYGGEEFVAILRKTNEERVLQVAERLRKSIEDLNLEHKGSNHHKLTVSIGVSTFDPNKPLSAKSLIELADKGLYQAKEGGRNQVRVSD